MTRNIVTKTTMCSLNWNRSVKSSIPARTARQTRFVRVVAADERTRSPPFLTTFVDPFICHPFLAGQYWTAGVPGGGIRTFIRKWKRGVKYIEKFLLQSTLLPSTMFECPDGRLDGYYARTWRHSMKWPEFA